MKRTESITDVCENLELHANTLRGYLKRKSNPCPRSRIKGKIRLDTAEVLHWMKVQKVSGQVGRPSHGDNKSINAARLRKENALADKYELQVAREKGLLMVAEEVNRAWGNVGRVIRNAFQDLAVSIVPMALRQGMPQKGAPILQSEVEQVVNDILKNLASRGDDKPKRIRKKAVSQPLPA